MVIITTSILIQKCLDQKCCRTSHTTELAIVITDLTMQCVSSIFELLNMADAKGLTGSGGAGLGCAPPQPHKLDMLLSEVKTFGVNTTECWLGVRKGVYTHTGCLVSQSQAKKWAAYNYMVNYSFTYSCA